jgi:hypothetical protein
MQRNVENHMARGASLKNETLLTRGGIRAVQKEKLSFYQKEV